jgi:hypothetical protein
MLCRCGSVPSVRRVNLPLCLIKHLSSNVFVTAALGGVEWSASPFEEWRLLGCTPCGSFKNRRFGGT